MILKVYKRRRDDEMKKVYVARGIDEEAIELLKEKFTVVVNPNDRELTREELKTIAPKYDGILTMLSNNIDKEIIDLAGQCKIFADYSVGYNNFDIEYAKEKGIVMTNTPGVLTNATADLAFALLLAASRRIVESDCYVRDGKFKEWKPKLLLGKETHGKTLGIIGMGRIGEAFVKRAMGFGFEIVYYNRTRKLEMEQAYGLTYLTLDELLKISDFVTIHTPLSKETFHFIGEREIGLMKEDVVFVNTSRGPVVDEKAMIAALDTGKFFGIGLDVYENEPLVPKELMRHRRAVLMPHIGSATEEARKQMAMIAVKNIIEVLEGREPLTPVN
jgi:glyoxylate reductase